ncbi:MAG: MgtC/SapB family protein [Proteobacteria bacterium]|nr:MgtC/SapB family protein [Pseudomonadota bacterium]
MNVDQLLYRLALALGIGLLVGLERGWKTRDMQPGSRAAGVRTFTLCGLLGGIVAALAQAMASPVGGGLVLGFGFAVYAAIFALFERDANRAAGSYSATTIVAGLLTFVLGAFAVIGDMRVAAAVAVAATVVLAIRSEIHGWIKRITWPELRSALVLLAMTFIILPVMPDVAVGGANPREVWLIAIVLAGVSFLGYVAVKALGSERGILFGAAAGGLVSSTAVTVTSAQRAAAGETAPLLLAAGVALASAVSFVRVVAIAAVLQPGLLPLIVPPLILAAVMAAGYALATIYWRAADGGLVPPGAFSNPFSFWPVVGFAVLLGAVILAGRFIAETFGAGGALIGAAALGLADVDTVTVAMSRLVPAPLDAFSAAMAILVAVVSNTASKLALAISLGRGRFAAEVAATTVLCWLAGAAGLWAAVAWGVSVPH